MDQIKEELSAQIKDFFPNESKKITFLSIGNDIGERFLLDKRKSDFSGEFIVENVKIDQNKYRRLVFMNNQNVIQSEARLQSVKSKKKKNIEVIDNRYLSCDHHKIIAACLCLLDRIKDDRISLVLVGLGGGCFVNFLIHNLSTNMPLNITVVEIDKAMLDIAQKWFDFNKAINQSSNISIQTEIIIQDGLEFINEQAKMQKQFDFIIFDVDSKNFELGVSCPPQEFIEESFLKQVQSCLTTRGMFILNLVARNEEVKQQIYHRLCSLFHYCILMPVEDDLNEIVICTNSKNFVWLQLKDAQQRCNHLRNSSLYMDIIEDTYKNICKKKPLSLH